MSKTPSEIAQDAKDEVRIAFNTWSTKLTDHSIQLAYAIIAANWAAHSPARTVIGNTWSVASLIVVFAFLAINLICEWYLSMLMDKQYNYAEGDHARWTMEADKHDGKVSSWPYTDCIVTVSANLRTLKLLLPPLASLLFALSLVFAESTSAMPTQPIPKSASRQNTSNTVLAPKVDGVIPIQAPSASVPAVATDRDIESPAETPSSAILPPSPKD